MTIKSTVGDFFRKNNIATAATQIKRLLKNKVKWSKKIQKKLAKYVVYQRKLALLKRLENGEDTLGELIDLLGQQEKAVKGYWSLLNKSKLKIDAEFKTQAQLFHELLFTRRQATDAGLVTIRRVGEKINDRHALDIYIAITKETLQEEEIAGEIFDAANIEESIRSGEATRVDHLARNIRKQRLLLIKIQSEFHVSVGHETLKDYLVETGILDRVKKLIEEEEAIFAIVFEGEKRIKNLDAILLQKYARGAILKERFRKLVWGTLITAMVATPLNIATVMVDRKIEEYLIARPGATSVEVTEVVREYIGSEQFQAILRGEGDQIISELAKELQISNPTRQQIEPIKIQAIETLATSITDQYISGLEAKGTILPEFDVGEITRSRQQIINAIATHINRHSGEQIIQQFRDLAAQSGQPAQEPSLWDMLSDPDFNKRDNAADMEQAAIAKLTDRLSVEISKVADAAVDATILILDTAAKEAIRAAAPGAVEKAMLGVYEFLKGYFWVVLLGPWVIGVVPSLFLFPWQKKKILRIYKQGYLRNLS